MCVFTLPVFSLVNEYKVLSKAVECFILLYLKTLIKCIFNFQNVNVE